MLFEQIGKKAKIINYTASMMHFLLYRKSTSIRHFEQCNKQLSNPICQNCDGSIKTLLDVGNQQHAVYYNSFIQIINFHGLFCNALMCRKTGACRILVPLRYFPFTVFITQSQVMYQFSKCDVDLFRIINFSEFALVFDRFRLQARTSL